MLIEPVGLLHGPEAAQARAQAWAAPLQGGPTAFCRARLIGDGRVVPVTGIPPSWAEAMRVVTAPCPPAALPAGPLVMGILNVTPDSFSDGGRHARPGDAIEAGLAMVQAGAALLDLGGESTRPGAAPVTPAQEQDRILPVLEGLRRRGARLSVDTRNAATMRAALQAGADLINDVSALSHDPDAPAVLAEASCPVVLVHSRGTPQTMAGLAQYDDVAAEVVGALAAAIARVVALGIARERLLVDPGIGFAKTAEQNLVLLRRLPILANLGCRVLLGASRKRFIGAVSGTPTPSARDAGSLVAALAGLVFPDVVLRVHDVPGTVQAVRVWRAMQG